MSPLNPQYKTKKRNLGIVLRGQHIVIDGDMKWYPDWKGQDGGVYDRDNSGKYKITLLIRP
jgi:hypothetical protein